MTLFDIQESERVAGPRPFIYHPAIVQNAPKLLLRAEVDRGHVDLLQGMALLRESPEEVVWEARTASEGPLSFRLRAEAHTMSPRVNFFLLPIYGREPFPDGSFQSRSVKLACGLKDASRDTDSFGALGAGDMLRRELDDTHGDGKRRGHGQGLPLFAWSVDFENMRVQQPTNRKPQIGHPTSLPPYFSGPRPRFDTGRALDAIAAAELRDFVAFDRTQYLPAYPPRSGDYDNFGVNHVLPDVYGGMGSGVGRYYSWLSQLANYGCQPGKLLLRDLSLCTHKTHPKLCLWDDGYPHRDSKDPAWYEEHDGDSMARTPDGTKWRCFDIEHWAVGPLFQAWFVYRCPGLEMLCEHVRETFFLQTPVVDKGPTVHKAGPARTQGRRGAETPAYLYWFDVLRGKPTAIQESGDHLVAMAEIIADTHEDKAAREDPWYWLEYWDPIGWHVPVWQHAVRAKGLVATLKALEAMGDAELAARIASVGIFDAKLTLSRFQRRDDGGWLFPYYFWPGNDEKNRTLGGNGRGMITWCLPAIQAAPDTVLDADEQAKRAAILEHYVDNRRNLGHWDETDEWLLS